MQRIDLKDVLQRTVSDVYGDLVTRPTGQAVRTGVEELLAQIDGEQITVMDFSTVRCLDFSCADEIVAKLLRHNGQGHYFLLYGVTAAHCEAIDQVLERHQVAVVARTRDGRMQLLGLVPETARQAFSVLTAAGSAGPEEIAEQLAVPTATVRQALNQLVAQRLVQQSADRYVALTD